MKIAIVGASGHLGRVLIDQLVPTQHQITAIARGPMPEEAGVRWVVADALDVGQLTRTLEGHDVVVDNVTPYKAGGAPRPNATEIEQTAHHNIIEAARRGGVTKTVLISVTAADRAQSVPHFWEKAKAERVHSESGLKSRIIRPGTFVDQEDSRFEKPAREKGQLPWLGSATTPFCFVETSEIAEDLILSLEREEDFEGVVDVGTVGTAQDMATLFARKFNRQVVVKPVPLGVFLALTVVPATWSPAIRNLRAMMRFVAGGNMVPVMKFDQFPVESSVESRREAI